MEVEPASSTSMPKFFLPPLIVRRSAPGPRMWRGLEICKLSLLNRSVPFKLLSNVLVLPTVENHDTADLLACQAVATFPRPGRKPVANTYPRVPLTLQGQTPGKCRNQTMRVGAGWQSLRTHLDHLWCEHQY